MRQHAALNSILKTLLDASGLKQQLEKVRDLLDGLPWIKAGSALVLLLADGEGGLVNATQVGVGAQLYKLCQQDSAGQCRCARTLRDPNISVSPLPLPGCAFSLGNSEPCGRYTLPLTHDGQPLGILVIAMPLGYEPQRDEIDFMRELGEAFAAVVAKRILEEVALIRELELAATRRETLARLGEIAEYRDPETGLHTQRVAKFCEIIGKFSGMPEADLELLTTSAPLHDIGKIAIPDAILLKNGPLNDEEFAVIKTHTTISAQMLRGDSDFLQRASQVALYHHERWDGTGYPQGLAGTDIPLEARICAIADVFDALTTVRPYKCAWPVEKAVEFITEEAGRQFDPELVGIFAAQVAEFERVMRLYNDEVIGIEQADRDSSRISGSSHTVAEELRTGIDTIDMQHQFLFELFDELRRAMDEHGSTVKLFGALTAIEEYAAIHFREEERMMAANGYPLLEEHIALHDSFKAKVGSLRRKLRSNPLLMGYDVLHFLSDWLQHHICRVDKEILTKIAASA